MNAASLPKCWQNPPNLSNYNFTINFYEEHFESNNPEADFSAPATSIGEIDKKKKNSAYSLNSQQKDKYLASWPL